MPTHRKPRVVQTSAAPTQKGRIIRRRHTRSHLKVWEYFHKKPHIQLPAHSFYENNEWFLYFSLILCRFYPRQRGGESLVVASFHLRLFAIGEARAAAANGGFIPAEALLPLRTAPCLGATFHASEAGHRGTGQFHRMPLMRPKCQSVNERIKYKMFRAFLILSHKNIISSLSIISFAVCQIWQYSGIDAHFDCDLLKSQTNE